MKSSSQANQKIKVQSSEATPRIGKERVPNIKYNKLMPDSP